MMHAFTNWIQVPIHGGKIIEEFLGVKREEDRFSIAHMIMPSGWSEPPHGTKFDEFVIVIKGELTITCNNEQFPILSG